MCVGGVGVGWRCTWISFSTFTIFLMKLSLIFVFSISSMCSVYFHSWLVNVLDLSGWVNRKKLSFFSKQFSHCGSYKVTMLTYSSPSFGEISGHSHNLPFSLLYSALLATVNCWAAVDRVLFLLVGSGKFRSVYCSIYWLQPYKW